MFFSFQQRKSQLDYTYNFPFTSVTRLVSNKLAQRASPIRSPPPLFPPLHPLPSATHDSTSKQAGRGGLFGTPSERRQI